jgi:pimeloyl-ACP methyl ester carboxylesterase
VPTLVIHGTADTLILPTGGRRTAELIPGAELLIVEGMGHDTPRPLWPSLVEAVTAHIARSERDSRPEPSTP